MDRVIILLAVVAATGLLSAWWKARDGRVRVTAPALSPDAPGPTPDHPHQPWSGMPVEAADLAAAVNSPTPLTLVEFTAPDCRPCVAAKAVLTEAITDRDDVTFTTLDVAEALDLARAHRVMRAPTTLLISDEGHLLGRVSGVPRPDELSALLDATRQPTPAVPARV